MRKISTTNLLFIDGLRAIAALYVLLHHAILQYYDADLHGLTGFKKITVAIFFKGHFAVNLFIVLSGFCLMLPVLRNDFKLKGGTLFFLKRRAVRILPTYYLAMLFSLILIWLLIGEKTGTHWDFSIPVNYKDLIAHLLLIFDFLKQYADKINHSFWSIAVESRIYLFFPLLLYCWRKLGPISTLIISAVIAIIGYLFLLYLHSFNPDIHINFPGVTPYIILFTMGMLAAYWSSVPIKFEIFKMNASMGLLFVLSVAFYFLVDKISTTVMNPDNPLVSHNRDIAFGVGCCCLLLMLANQNEKPYFIYTWLKNIISWKPLVWIGTFSYSLYLIHAPMLQVLSQYVIDPMHLSRYISAFLLIAVSLIVIIPVAYLFYIVSERPFLNFGKKMNFKKAEVETILNPAP